MKISFSEFKTKTFTGAELLAFIEEYDRVPWLEHEWEGRAFVSELYRSLNDYENYDKEYDDFLEQYSERKRKEYEKDLSK